MHRLIIWFLILWLIGERVVDAQNIVSNKMIIRSYNYSQTLSVHGVVSSSKAYDSYGSVIWYNNTDDTPYSYQAQEYDVDLGLSFFPSRVYSSNTIRFETPDPKSQYHSPYLFVGGDPVNMVDKNGEEGKRLVFYEELYEKEGITTELSLHENMKELEGDSYFVPLRDLENEVPLNIPEWNGEVYFLAHMKKSGNMEVAKMNKGVGYESKFVNKEALTFSDAVKPQYSGFILADSRSLGHKLRLLSKMKKTDVSSISVAGCHGESTAKRLGQGFTAGFEDEAKSIKLMGLRKDYIGLLAGERTSAEYTATPVEGMKEFRYHYLPEDRYHSIRYRYAKNKATGATRFHSYQIVNNSGNLQPMRYFAGDEVRGYASGRMPVGHESAIRSLRLPY